MNCRECGARLQKQEYRDLGLCYQHASPDVMCPAIGCTEKAWAKNQVGYVPMCREHFREQARQHKAALNGSLMALGAANLSALGLEAPADHADINWCYVVSVMHPEEGPVIKIGSAKRGSLGSRFTKLEKDYGWRPEVHAVLTGYTTTEHLLHAYWDAYRMARHQELFMPDIRLMDWVRRQGIHDDAKPELYAWWAKGQDL